MTYCKRRIETMQGLLDSGSAGQAMKQYEAGMRERIKLFSEFIAWAEKQPGGAK